MKNFVDVLAKEFVIFKTGTWNGETFTEKDLDNMVSNFNANEPPHIIVGHSSDYKGHTRIPSFGRVLGGLKRVGNELIAYGAEFNEKLAEWIKEGFYNQRSVEMSADNKRILAIGMLGATPPAVKGMPAMDEALNEIALEYSEKSGMKVIEFAEVEPIVMSNIDEVEALAVDDTFKSITECCAEFLTKIETLLTLEPSYDELNQEVWKLQADLCNTLNLHSQFIEKIDQIEEANQMSEKSGWKEFKETLKSLFTKRKESIVDLQKEKEYQEKIAELEAKNKEFADKEAVAVEAKRVAEEIAIADAALAKDESLKNEIKSFCDKTILDNKMTPAMREVDEPIMFTLAKTSADALKSFQEKYSTAVVPLGESKEMSQIDNDKRPQVIKDAELYVASHEKEFASMSKADATNRALYLQSVGKIKFADKK